VKKSAVDITKQRHQFNEEPGKYSDKPRVSKSGPPNMLPNGNRVISPEGQSSRNPKLNCLSLDPRSVVCACVCVEFIIMVRHRHVFGHSGISTIDCTEIWACLKPIDSATLNTAAPALH
jgi:hypothetical protein